MEWRYPEQSELEGVEFRALASGLHSINSDFMYVRVCTFVCVCIYVCICTYVCVRMCVYVHMCVYVLLLIDNSLCVHTVCYFMYNYIRYVYVYV